MSTNPITVPGDIERAIARYARRVTRHRRECICARCAQVRVRGRRYFRRWKGEGVAR